MGVGSVQAGGEFHRLGSLYGMGGSLKFVGGEGIGDGARVDPDAPEGDGDLY